jgi:hypothetical protein
MAEREAVKDFPLHGYDAERTVKADARVLVTLEARDPTLATMLHAARFYAPADIRFGMRYTDAVTAAEDGTLVATCPKLGRWSPASGRPGTGLDGAGRSALMNLVPPSGGFVLKAARG